MDLSLTPEVTAFQEEVREFIRENLPKEIIERNPVGFSSNKENIRRWHKILHDKGWVSPSWPVEYGGTGWSATQKFIFDEELSTCGAPRLLPFGLSMVGPVIYSFGTEEQKQQHLPGIRSGDTWWCQGYSEPGAGSDLASLKTTAVRDGDHYIVNGQKIWTSYAHQADWIFCLVRTDPDVKPQEGISFLLIDMKTPGVEVKPIVSIDGLHHLNETFFSDVRVPVANRIGEENKGWTYAKFLLMHERTSIAGVAASRQNLQRIREIAKQPVPGADTALIADPDFGRKLAEIDVKLTALEYTNLRSLSDQEAGRPMGAETSMLKIVGTEVQQALQELAVELAGLYMAPYVPQAFEGSWNEPPIGPDWAMAATGQYSFGRAATIYGGSNEIQRGVIAKAVLGL